MAEVDHIILASGEGGAKSDDIIVERSLLEESAMPLPEEPE